MGSIERYKKWRMHRVTLANVQDKMRTIKNARFDLWVGNARVEIKAARWFATKRGAGRYQANMHKSQADVIVFVAINGCDHDFIIPAAAIGPRKTLEVNSYDVSAYRGQWTGYLEAYGLLLATVAAAPERPRQLTLGVKND